MSERNTKGATIVFMANTDWYLANFRLDLARALKGLGAEVHCIAPPGRYLRRLGEQGFPTHALEMGDESYSPLGNYRTLRHVKALYREIRPDLVHHFTPRCVLLGSMAARGTGVPAVVNALTGLGHVFTTDSLRSGLARPVLRRLLKRYLAGSPVIFQNGDDMAELIAAGVVTKRQCRLVRGSGVDTERFRPSGVHREDDEFRVLFASRLIREKGIDELVAAVERVAARHENARLWIAGEPYAQNPTSLKPDDLRRLESLPWLRRLGHVDDVDRLLAQVDVVALPSYREGTPRILLEAASCGLPIVATDIAGCRGVVEEGVNGFLVPARSSDALAERILQLYSDDGLRRRMGEKGRQIILDGFSSAIVVEKTLEVYGELLG